MTDNERYSAILKLAEEFGDPRQQAEVGKHLCLNAAEYISPPSLQMFVTALTDRQRDRKATN